MQTLGQDGKRLVGIFHFLGILIVTDFVCLSLGYKTNTFGIRQWAERILKRRQALPPGYLIDAKAARSGMLSQRMDKCSLEVLPPAAS